MSKLTRFTVYMFLQIFMDFYGFKQIFRHPKICKNSLLRYKKSQYIRKELSLKIKNREGLKIDHGK